MGDILKFHRMSVEEICKKLLHEPFVCQMLTTEYKSVVDIPDNVQFFCMVCQGIFVLLILWCSKLETAKLAKEGEI